MPKNNQGPYKLYSPAVREPLPLRRKPYILPAPPEMPDKPQKIDWLRTLLPPFIMMGVLSIVATVLNASGFIAYTIVMMTVYPVARALGYLVQKTIYDHKEKLRAQLYSVELEHADREIVDYIRKQRDLLKGEFQGTIPLCQIAELKGDDRKLWYRTSSAIDFLALRLGIFDGKPSFPIEVPKGEDIDIKDPLLKETQKLKQKYQFVKQIPFLLQLREFSSVAILGDEKFRYGLAYRILLDVLVHHRPDEVEIYVLSTHKKAIETWGWLRWAPHCKVFDENKDFEHLIFGNQALKVFLGRFENYVSKNAPSEHQIFIIDVDGIQQYDDDFIQALLSNAQLWNLSLIFVGGSNLPRSIRGILKYKDLQNCIFVDTKIDVKDKEEKEYHTVISLDEFPELNDCEKVSRALSSVKLLSSAGDILLSPNTTLYDVLGLGKEDKLTFENVVTNWSNGKELRAFKEKELLQFPVGLVDENSQLTPYYLNLLEARFGGKDAYHAMLIGTTGSGKSEFIKSLILSGVYRYPPQYLNFFCMDFKGGSTVDQLEKLPHVVGVMTNMDEVLAQRGLIAINYEIDWRQKQFNEAGVKDIWQFNEGKTPDKIMPHLVLILDEFTRGLDLLSTPEFNLQDLLEKRLVPQGRSLGIYLLLANQVANAKALKLLPNVGWRIALRVASKEQLNFIAPGLKSTKYAGRGYIQATGDDTIEFQSGYSGSYVQYTNMQIKPKNVSIKQLLPNGTIRILKNSTINLNGDQAEFSSFLQINQIIQSTLTAQLKMDIASAPKIYLPPLSRKFTLDQLESDPNRFFRFSAGGWDQNKNGKSFLQAPIGYADLVFICDQKLLFLDFFSINPNLLLVGSQSDIIEGLRSILLALFLSYSPDEVQIYFLEFGAGLTELPKYPHIGDIILEQEAERIARTIEFFEGELEIRKELSQSGVGSSQSYYPHLFLIVNNIAGIKDNLDLYSRIFRFVLQDSHKYGIHLIILALPRGSGTRIPAGDLKVIKSRIVFPSINHEDYWYYLDIAERRLVKLTEMDQPLDDNDEKPLSRAYWLCTNDPQYDVPVEIQLAKPKYKGQSDISWAAQMINIDGLTLPKKIKILEKQYPLRINASAKISCQFSIEVGIKRSNLQEYLIPIEELPQIWGVSGPRESGKTNFLTMLLEQFPLDKFEIDVFSVFYNQLTSYCEKKDLRSFCGSEYILDRLKNIDEDLSENRKPQLLFFDDLNHFWERDNDVNKNIRIVLENLSSWIYKKQDVMIVASFNYSQHIRAARSHNALIREIHDNKTGLCLGYEGDWVVNNVDLGNYKKKLDGAVCPGRGVFVLKGQETEVQTLFYEGGEN